MNERTLDEKGVGKWTDKWWKGSHEAGGGSPGNKRSSVCSSMSCPLWLAWICLVKLPKGPGFLLPCNRTSTKCDQSNPVARDIRAEWV